MSDQTSQQQVQPGRCPDGVCPPFDRIECIVVDKVYDSCFQIENVDRTSEITTGHYGEFETGPFAVGDTVQCMLTPGKEITCREISRTAAGDGFFTITIVATVPVTLINPNNPNETSEKEFTFTKTVTLCCPQGVSPDCSESTLLHCVCVVSEVEADEIEVTCDLQICLVIKCILRVQLLVPSYGFCVPAPCITIPGVCPPLPPEQCF